MKSIATLFLALNLCIHGVLTGGNADSNLAADDLLIADFEAETYGDWKVSGNAFGDGPARGTLPGQMDVSGFRGQGLVNSFHGGDASTGTLTSPPIVINRDFITFLIGGGGFPGETCMQLIVDGQVVREATGSNTVAGGSESLTPDSWDVRDLAGSTVSIRIVDNHTGGWGHINVDEIKQTDERPVFGAAERSLLVDQDYLLIPIKNGAPKTKLVVSVNGEPIRKYDTELATDPDDVDWFAFFHLGEYRGKQITVSAAKATEKGFGMIGMSATIPKTSVHYDEPLRPQLRFSQAVGWINDPNGMVYSNGEWHLYFQHNPVGWAWGNMTWGHAVTKDLVHWEQLPNVLFPYTMAKGACFSGGAVIDHRNTSGWKTGDNELLVAFLTDTDAGESVVYSNDNGRTFTWYENNPIVRHQGRDPKVVWYAYDENDDQNDDDTPLNATAKSLGGHWVMAVYDESKEYGQNTAFYTSTDLKDWKLQSQLPGYFECPELFELSIAADKNEDANHHHDERSTSWVTFAADGQYVLGEFDGKTFTPSHADKHRLHYGKFYASQTFENAPNGRRIQIGWMRGVEFQGESFNQPFSIPQELTLRRTADGVRMFSAPVDELKSLRTKTHSLAAQSIPGDEAISLDVGGELLDVEASLELGDAKNIVLDIGGNTFTYDVRQQTWNGAEAKATDGIVSVRVLLDRSLIECWANGGAVVISGAREKRGVVHQVRVTAEGSGAKLLGLQVHELKSIWK